MLERRIVLNATAELSALGDLLISGDGANDFIRIGPTDGGRLEIFDANDAVIPIRTGTDSLGNPILIDSIAPSQIASGRLTVNLGGGDDSLQVDLPADLDLDVIDGAGTDSVTVTLRGDANNSVDQTINLNAESIAIDADSNSLDLSRGRLQANSPGGSIDIQNAQAIQFGDVDVARGSFNIGRIDDPTLGRIIQAPDTSIQASEINVFNDGDLILDEATNSIANAITISSTGDVEIVSARSLTVDSAVGRNFILSATGDSSDLLVGDVQVQDAGTGDVQLNAGDDIGSIRDGTGAVPRLVADELIVRAGNANDDGSVAVDLVTQVNGLDAVVAGTNRGDLVIDELDSIRLASSEINGDAAVVMTGNGLIDIRSGGSIFIDDGEPANDGDLLTGDQEIVAGGAQGGIRFNAADDFEAGDSVQLAATNVDPGTVSITANRVILGDDFEINTGRGEGIARRFSPRPDPDGLQLTDPVLNNDPNDPDFIDVETAFYDVDSVTTDILSQFNENDAIGTLSLDIGAEGENGLVLSIDWGAESNRFQEVSGLPGSRSRVDVQHVYLEDDILNSTLNGRASATDPLAVRFAVSHHPSIEINGRIIEQTIPSPSIDRVREIVPGGDLSSTDIVPTIRPGLDNGRAFFDIPRIDVPVAFFPNRDVIPEITDPPPPVFTTSPILMSDVQLNSAEASASSITIREEYFQLRSLSPDPEGDDLIEPVRLPEGVLSGDRLAELFSKLPDGGYEIEYVLGDGDQRTILRVELRGGESIILGDDLESGALKLKWIEGSSEAFQDDPPHAERVFPDTDGVDRNLDDSETSNPNPNGIQSETPNSIEIPLRGMPLGEIPNDAEPIHALAVTTLAPLAFSRADRFLKKVERINANASKPATRGAGR